MRNLYYLLIFLALLACNRSKKIEQLAIRDTVKIEKRKENVAASESFKTGIEYPSDTTYPARLLPSGYSFHDGEVDPQSDTYRWKGIFKTDTGYYLTDTKVILSRTHDEVLDEKESDKTGWMVNSDIKDTAVILISGVDYLNNKSILKVKLPANAPMPGERHLFTYNGIAYTLYATGVKRPERPGGNGYFISKYKLFIKAKLNGQSYNQLLLSITGFDDGFANIMFAGDIDGDLIPDFIIDTSYHYNLTRPTLYFSKPAEKGNLLKVMAMHSSVGC
jgi:hypothetical protein